MGNANTTTTSEGSGDIDQLHNINVTLVSYSQYQTILISSIFFMVTLILTVEVTRAGIKCFPDRRHHNNQSSWSPVEAAEEGLLDSGQAAEADSPIVPNPPSDPPPPERPIVINVKPKALVH